MKKGDVVRGTGAMGLCLAKVISTYPRVVKVEWLEGVLAGREGLVPREMLRASGEPPPSQGSSPPAPEATEEER